MCVLLNMSATETVTHTELQVKDGCNAFAQGAGIGGIAMFAALIFVWIACWCKARGSAKQQAAMSSAPGHNEMQQLPSPGYSAAQYGQPGQQPYPAQYGQPGQQPYPAQYGQPGQQPYPAQYGQPGQQPYYGQQ
jgi:hypothetical protein